jgi:transglutaminase-like putative cysteine protease
MTKRWRSTLSREGRDTLWLLGVLTLCVLPHMARLPLWCAIASAAAIAWRAGVAWRDAALPPRWLLLVCLGLSVGLTLWTFHSLFGREAGVTLVTLLAALKTLELRARRDAFVVTSLGFFLILTQFLYSQSLPIAMLMLLVLVGLLTSLVLAQRPLGRPSIASAIKVALGSLLMGLPVMLALYVLFPRLGPLWSVPADAGQRTGLSERIDLGNMAELAQDDSVAMRIRFSGPPPAARELYFRGPVLDSFDGKTWRARKRPPGSLGPDDTEPVLAEGPPHPYQVTLEPNRINNVPMLEGTLAAEPAPPYTEPLLRREGLSWFASAPMEERTQIDARAWHITRYGPEHAMQSLGAWLQLPAGLNPRTVRWAWQLRQQLAQADARGLSQAVLQHIRRGNFRYTLAPEDHSTDDQGLPQPHLIDRFWIDHQNGFCEHFAAAYVVVMRAMGVPARVVTGFQGAELNPVDGLYVVRNSDAHAWAEFWQEGVGWTRVDPTAAVAPERVERPRQAALTRSPLPGPLANIDPAVWGRMRAYMEAGNHRWNLWVLQYSRNRQLALLKDWGFDSPDWMDLVRLCGGVLAGTSLFGVAWLWWTRPRRARMPWQKPLARVHRALTSAGLAAPGNCPAPAPAMSWDKAVQSARANEQQASLKPALQTALQQLDALRYAANSAPERARLREGQALADVIEQHARQWRALARRDRAN